MGTEASLNGDNCYTSQTSAQQSLAAVPIFTIKETKRGIVMAQYIDKDALMAELKKRISDYWGDSANTIGIFPHALEEVIKYVDTLEVKEVDLEKEIDYNPNRPESEETILHRAMEVYGYDAQINRAIEEMGELIVALQHRLRGKASIDEVREEIADVQIMMEQLAIIVGAVSVRNFYDAKIKRLEQRLNKED